MLVPETTMRSVSSGAATRFAVLREARYEKSPEEVATPQALADRRRFLTESLAAPADASAFFERVIGGDDLQPVAYLARGAIAARAVARIEIRDSAGGLAGYGSGFLIAPSVLITNNHVLPNAAVARSSLAEFDFEEDVTGIRKASVRFELLPDHLFHTDRTLDFTVVAISEHARDGGTRLDAYGCLPLLAESGKASEGEWLTLVQHPDGKDKKICVRENQLIQRNADTLWYTTDTLPGSSGSPVFNNDWYVVALHHAGVPQTRNGVAQTTDGRDYDAQSMSPERIRWIGNEGIRASRIHQTLRLALPDEALLQPLYAATPASARIGSGLGGGTDIGNAATASSAPRAVVGMSGASWNTSPNGRQAMAEMRTITIPVEIRVSVPVEAGMAAPAVLRGGEAGVGTAAREMAALEADTPERTRGSSRPTSALEAPFDPDYGNRSGYRPDFLGADALVALPELGPANSNDAAPLLGSTKKNFELKYTNFSVVMNARRRLAFFSAANVSFGNRYEMGRPHDVWRRDPRIDTRHQLDGYYYVRNKFDRGHLTRREDLEFGPSPQAALASAGDTCHWTNCTPQHERFNQNKEIWQGIERYILEQSIYHGNFNAQILTGPIFSEADPVYRDVQYPLQFWKVVAALRADGSLFATAYLASQEEVIREFGIEAVEVPFGAYKTFQVSIAEIERLTGLTFLGGPKGAQRLTTFEPKLRTARRTTGGFQESLATFGAAGPYREIATLEDIQF